MANKANERMSYWMPPNNHFLPATGCMPTGRVVTFHQLPRSEWSCPNEYPGLPLHPEYHSVMWWERPTLSGLGTWEGGLTLTHLSGAGLGALAGFGLARLSDRSPIWGAVLGSIGGLVATQLSTTAQRIANLPLWWFPE